MSSRSRVRALSARLPFGIGTVVFALCAALVVTGGVVLASGTAQTDDGEEVHVPAAALPAGALALSATPALADPTVTVQVGRRSRAMTAREATSAERDELWPRLVERYADFAEYQANTSRVIPVVICEPAERSRAGRSRRARRSWSSCPMPRWRRRATSPSPKW